MATIPPLFEMPGADQPVLEAINHYATTTPGCLTCWLVEMDEVAATASMGICSAAIHAAAWLCLLNDGFSDALGADHFGDVPTWDYLQLNIARLIGDHDVGRRIGADDRSSEELPPYWKKQGAA